MRFIFLKKEIGHSITLFLMDNKQKSPLEQDGLYLVLYILISSNQLPLHIIY